MSSKSSKKKAGLFDTWIRNFVIIVFTQSFHSVFLMFILFFVSKIGSIKGNDIFVALVTIVAMSAIIKFEKLIKETFGIGDSKLGGVGENFYKSIQAARSAANMGARTMQPFKEHGIARRNLENKSKGLESAARDLKSSSPGFKVEGAGNENYLEMHRNKLSERDSTEQARSEAGKHQGGTVKGTGNVDSAGLENALNRLSGIIENQNRTAAKGGVIGVGGTAGTAGAGGSVQNFNDKLEKYNTAKSEYEDAKLQEKKTGMQRFTRLGTTLAATGMAMGGTSDMETTFTVANMVDSGLDNVTDHMVNSSVNRGAYKEAIDNNDYRRAEQIKESRPISYTKELGDAWLDAMKTSVGVVKKTTKEINKLDKNITVDDIKQ